MKTASKENLTELCLGDDIFTSLGVGASFGFVSALAQGIWASIPARKLGFYTLQRTGQFALIAGLFRGSSIYTAKLRNKDDPWNYFVGGGLTGAVAGFVKANGKLAIAYGLFTAFSVAGASAIHDRYIERAGLPPSERNKRPDFFAFAPKDPYANRIEEMKARTNQ